MTTAYPAIIQQLVVLSTADAALNTAIGDSLSQAYQTALQDLDAGLFSALAWPQPPQAGGMYNLTSYFEYLNSFYRWRPIEASASYWQGYDGRRALGSQEIYDRLCHFYFLINQEVTVGEHGPRLQNYGPFAVWLDNFAIAWGAFLSTSQSFSMDEVKSYINNAPLYAVQDSLTNTSQPYKPVGGPWDSFNAFFGRALTSPREITDPASNLTITRPADCTYHADYPIGSDGQVGKIRVKGMSTPATVGDLLGNEAYNKVFAGGRFIHYFLAPYSYHRFHAPVSGTIADCGVISTNIDGSQSQAYLAVRIDPGKKPRTGQFDAPDDSTDGYEFTQTRGFVVVDTTEAPEGNVGMVAAVPIGMAQVSSVVLKDAYGYTLQDQSPLSKGEQFGFFQFGGSDIIILIQDAEYKKATLNTRTNAPGQYTPHDYYHYGTEIIKIAR